MLCRYLNCLKMKCKLGLLGALKLAMQLWYSKLRKSFLISNYGSGKDCETILGIKCIKKF